MDLQKIREEYDRLMSDCCYLLKEQKGSLAVDMILKEGILYAFGIYLLFSILTGVIVCGLLIVSASLLNAVTTLYAQYLSVFRNSLQPRTIGIVFLLSFALFLAHAVIVYRELLSTFRKLEKSDLPFLASFGPVMRQIGSNEHLSLKKYILKSKNNEIQIPRDKREYCMALFDLQLLLESSLRENDNKEEKAQVSEAFNRAF